MYMCYIYIYIYIYMLLFHDFKVRSCIFLIFVFLILGIKKIFIGGKGKSK